MVTLVFCASNTQNDVGGIIYLDVTHFSKSTKVDILPDRIYILRDSFLAVTSRLSVSHFNSPFTIQSHESFILDIPIRCTWSDIASFTFSFSFSTFLLYSSVSFTKFLDLTTYIRAVSSQGHSSMPVNSLPNSFRSVYNLITFDSWCRVLFSKKKKNYVWLYLSKICLLSTQPLLHRYIQGIYGSYRIMGIQLQKKP